MCNELFNLLKSFQSKGKLFIFVQKNSIVTSYSQFKSRVGPTNVQKMPINRARRNPKPKLYLIYLNTSSIFGPIVQIG